MSDFCGITASPRENELVLNGWEKQFTCDEPRLSEATELFESMGKDVIVENVVIENLPNGDACKECFISCSGEVKTIWTRTKNTNKVT